MIKKVIAAVISSTIVISSCSIIPTTYNIEFKKQPCLIPVEAKSFELCKNFYIKINKESFKVPKGFRTDLASIPKVLWIYKGPNEFESIAPAVVHDYLYRCDDKTDRKYADDIFYSMLIQNGASHATAIKYYIGVRIFGGKFYYPKECNGELD